MARKAFFILTLACLIALSGCAVIDKFQPKRTIADNVFFSSANPQIRMQVNPAFTYLGAVEGSPVNNREGGLRNAIDDDEINSKQFSYLFAESTKARRLSQGVIIRLCTVLGDPDQWSPDLLAGAGNILETGKIEIEDLSTSEGLLASREPYRYGIFTSADLFTRSEEALIAGKGIAIPPCLLVKSLEKSTGLGNKSQMHLLYFEDIGGDACGALAGAPTLSDDQTALIGAFVDRSNRAIQFMDSREVSEAPRLIAAPPSPAQKELPAPPAATAPAAEGTGQTDIGSKLLTLKQLLDKGLITPEDYNEKKKELLKDF